ncbi:MAG: hypothetical protein ABEJ28_02385 [Salinigranum sp.]
MRFKPVPDPPDAPDPSAALDTVAAAQRAVPLVPGTQADCCGRLLRRCDFESRDVARTWLTFLRALELVEETDRGFRRLRVDPTLDRLRAAFGDRVFGAREVLDALAAAGDPLTLDDAFARVAARVPAWERHRNPRRWEGLWRDRTEAILGWLVSLGLAEEVDGGYVAIDDPGEADDD